MATPLKNFTIPTVPVPIPPELLQVDAVKVANAWFDSLKAWLGKGEFKEEEVKKLWIDEGFWRDILALTWDFRTFTPTAIPKFLQDRLSSSGLDYLSLELDSALYPIKLSQPGPNLVHIEAFFKFKTKVGNCDGIFRLVPTKAQDNWTWKAWTFFTNLNSLISHPFLEGHNRPVAPPNWIKHREEARSFETSDPQVLIIGGGQAGLETAARLGALEVKTLVVERNERIGDNWRKRYASLKLHDYIWYDHMPYIPFPSTWPAYIPAAKLADWLESYASILEINVWLSSNVVSVTYDEQKKQWEVTLHTKDGSKKVKCNQIVVATGIGGGLPNLPKFEGQEKFKGEIVHSSKFKSGADWKGKKVVVIGSATSSNDICLDLAEHGVDVTMVQRSSNYIMSVEHGIPRCLSAFWREGGPPTEIADMLYASYPLFVHKQFGKLITESLKEADKDLLANLSSAGYNISWGEDGSGFLMLAYQRGGGYYLDVGACQAIIDGRIKIKSGKGVARMYEGGLELEDGEKLEADGVVLATGYGSVKDGLKGVLEDHLWNELKAPWTLNGESEVKAAWRGSGRERLYFMIGNLAMCRFHSKHVALQIKATEEGLFEEKDRYSFD